jgi:hypothetical protein
MGLGRQAGKAMVSRAVGSGPEMEVRDWRRRIIWQVRLEKEIKTYRVIFLAHKKITSQKKDLVIRRNKGLFAKKQMSSSWSDQNARA